MAVTGMRASILMKLPALTKGGEDLAAALSAAVSEGVDLGLAVNGVIVNRLDIRLVDGSDGMLEISPSSRLCIQVCRIRLYHYKIK
jgi:hypothetical protein